MTKQHIGAWLDKLFIIGFGLFALIISPRVVGKNLSAGEAKKRIRILRACGIVMILCGIGSIIFMLF